MYQNNFHPDDTRFRTLPVEYSYGPRYYAVSPQLRFAGLRQTASEALIALGNWIKPQAKSNSRKLTAQLQSR